MKILKEIIEFKIDPKRFFIIKDEVKDFNNNIVIEYVVCYSP